MMKREYTYTAIKKILFKYHSKFIIQFIKHCKDKKYEDPEKLFKRHSNRTNEQ